MELIGRIFALLENGAGFQLVAAGRLDRWTSDMSACSAIGDACVDSQMERGADFVYFAAREAQQLCVARVFVWQKHPTVASTLKLPLGSNHQKRAATEMELVLCGLVQAPFGQMNSGATLRRCVLSHHLLAKLLHERSGEKGFSK